MNIGDVFYNTVAHKEIDNTGNKTVRVGSTVPSGAVNLGYYFNTTASLEDTVSIIETNTNTSSLKYVEEWVHKSLLPNNNDNNFSECIDFEGKKGTELEGYWGVLFKKYVIWEEEPIIDQGVENKVLYEEFHGLSEKKVPMTKYYNDGTKSGTLTLAHEIYTAINFKDSLDQDIKFDSRRWNCKVKYEGLIQNNVARYNGSAKYAGVVSKKDGATNIDPEEIKEVIMFPNQDGILHNSNNDNLLDDDLFYITDKFKDGKPLYYKHKLRLKIYDSLGSDRQGTYDTRNIKLVYENGMPVNKKLYKFAVSLEKTQYENVYTGIIYTSFVPDVSNPIYAMYDGVPEQECIDNPLSVKSYEVKIGAIEKLSVLQAYDTEDYTVNKKVDLTNKSTITVNNGKIINDTREKIKIQFIVESENITTPPITVEVINKKYATHNELELFKDDDMIVSSKDINGFMTAKDMLFSYISDEEKKEITDDSIFRVVFNIGNKETLYNRDKVLLFTDTDGKGFIYARTYCDTGLTSEEGIGNLELDTNSIYYSKDNKIYKCFSVMCRNINQILISTPSEKNILKSWYPKIRYSYFEKAYERIDTSTNIVYSIPEYTKQTFGVYGMPYIDVKEEKPRVIGINTVKVCNTPMYIKIDSHCNPINVEATKLLADGTRKKMLIRSFNFLDGTIDFIDKISDNDDILINYTYEEQYYHYKGYYEDSNKDSKLIDLDLNPSMYSTFTDTSNEFHERKNTYELFNRVIHFFVKPMKVINKTTNKVEVSNEFTVYHKFDSQEPITPFDLYIGRVFVRHHTSLQSTRLIDTRTRGGGVIEEISDEVRRELEPESDYYLDIGTLDGKPYHENSVIIARIDNRVLKINGGRFSEEEVRTCVERWSAYGSYVIIEFVDVMTKEESPQSSLTVTRCPINKIHYKPHCIIEVIER